MCVVEKSKRRTSAAAKTIRQISAEASTQLEAPEDQNGEQILHRAKSESESQSEIVSSPVEPLPDTIPLDVGTSNMERKINELLDQIDEGLRADDATNFEKLTIARKYGPLLWDVKALAAHGEFMNKLKERFPKINYAKCNRWMYLAKHEVEVLAAIEAHPSVAWGPKKMIDFLKGNWTPDEEEDGEEDDCYGAIREDHVKEDPLFPEEDGNGQELSKPDVTSPFAVGALNPDLEVEEHKKQEALDAQETASSPVPKAVKKQPRPVQTLPFKRPEVKRTEYEVELQIGFKLSVPSDVSVNDIKEAIRIAKHWTLGIETSFEYELSETGVVVGHVKPWTAPAIVVQD